MAGFAPNRARLASAGSSRTTEVDTHNPPLRVDLVGVRTEVASRVTAGELLDITLVRRGEMLSAVCQTRNGDIVGALAAFRGLARLIKLLEEGAALTATATYTSPARCEVLIGRFS